MIYGYGTKSKKIRYLGRRYCQNCNGFTNYYLYWQYSYYSLFFIPIIRITKAYYIGCDACQLGKEISKEDAVKIKKEYLDFPTEAMMIKVMHQIQDWIHNDYTLVQKEDLIKSIESYCHFGENRIQYLENLIDNVCIVEKERMDNELPATT